MGDGDGDGGEGGLNTWCSPNVHRKSKSNAFFRLETRFARCDFNLKTLSFLSMFSFEENRARAEHRPPIVRQKSPRSSTPHVSLLLIQFSTYLKLFLSCGRSLTENPRFSYVNRTGSWSALPLMCSEHVQTSTVTVCKSVGFEFTAEDTR
jgi:hypothetical protein